MKHSGWIATIFTAALGLFLLLGILIWGFIYMIMTTTTVHGEVWEPTKRLGAITPHIETVPSQPRQQVYPNMYGPSVNSDATGRPFSWQPQGTSQGQVDPNLKVTPNVYGPGMGADQYGRPVPYPCNIGGPC